MSIAETGTPVEHVEGEIVLVHDDVMLGAIPTKPQEIVARASAIATELGKIIDTKKLFKQIKEKKYVFVEGWNTLGAMLGILPVENRVLPIEGGWEAYVDLIRASDGMKIGGSSAICTRKESHWASAADYAVRSMAITRATGKAFRLGFSWIMQLAGYEPTPGEEVTDEGPAVVPATKAEPAKKAEATQKPAQAKAPATDPSLHEGKMRLVKELEGEFTPEQIKTAMGDEFAPKYMLENHEEVKKFIRGWYHIVDGAS
jgi:hypothetical protein